MSLTGRILIAAALIGGTALAASALRTFPGDGSSLGFPAIQGFLVVCVLSCFRGPWRPVTDRVMAGVMLAFGLFIVNETPRRSQARLPDLGPAAVIGLSAWYLVAGRFPRIRR